MRFVSILFGLVLLVIAIAGVAWLVRDFGKFKAMVLDGTPYVLEYDGKKRELPGQAVAVVAVFLTGGCAAASVWLIRPRPRETEPPND